MKYIKKFKLYESLEEEIDEIEYSYGIESNINKHVQEYANAAIKEFLAITPFWDNIEIVYVKSLKNKNIIGLYRNSTSTSTPIIMLDQNALLKSSKNYKVTLENTTKTTIWHEIGHAIVELDKELDLDQLEFTDEEEFVEDISYEIFKYGTVPQMVEDFYEFYINT